MTVRLILLALGAWGLAWMVGMLASLYVRPHVAGDSGLRIRYCLVADIAIPWETIAAVTTPTHPGEVPGGAARTR